ncbi:MAG: hypothetical protein ACREFI_12220 [Stellaceae bacterium]
MVSLLERGRGAGASINTWARVMAAAGEQLVAFAEHAPGAERPRDIEHVKRQSSLIAFAIPGGWRALPELAIDPASPRSRSIDVALVRAATHEAVVAEIWDWFDDVGAGFRSLDAKRQTLIQRLEAESRGGDPWTVRALYVVRDTRRNHALLAEARALFAARFPGSPQAWLKALTQPECRLPDGDGLLWSDRSGTILRASRLRG